MEMVVQGVSTRKVTKITEELCGTSFSKSTVSSLCKQLDPVVYDWNERDLGAHSYPFLLVDAIVLKVREDGRIRSRSALIATGVNETGVREYLGFKWVIASQPPVGRRSLPGSKAVSYKA